MTTGEKSQRAHYIRSNYTSALPYRMLFFDTETRLVGEPETGLQVFRLGAACYCVNDDKVFDSVREKWFFLGKRNEVYSMIESLAYDDSVLHVYGSNLSFDISGCHLIDYLSRRNWELVAYREKGLTFILIVKNGKKKIKFISMQNFLPTSIKALGKLIGIEKLEIDYNTEDTEKLMNYCIRDVVILKEGILNWYRFVLKHDLGGHAITLPSQAFRAFRHKFMKHKILVHGDPVMSQYERAAYHGGRCEIFRKGIAPADNYIQLDVNSMYPFVMSRYQYPTQRIGYIERHNLSMLKQTLKNNCTIALVLVYTEEPVFLKTLNGKACFPIGRYWTLLTTRSLIYGLRNGLIRDVWSGVYYKKRNLFKNYVKYFYDLRAEYTRDGNQIYREIAKKYMNTLYGKFGEKTDVVISDEYNEDDRTEILQYYNAETAQYGTETTMLHRTITTQGETDGLNAVVSIAAHVTDDARLMLWQYMKRIGLDKVFYTDTDSIITTQQRARERAEKYIGSDLGMLKIEKESPELSIYGAKNYSFGDKRVIKGVQRIDHDDGVETYHSLHSLSIGTLARNGITGGAVLKPVELKLTGDYDKGIIEPDGSVIPFRLFEKEESPEWELDSLLLHEKYRF